MIHRARRHGRNAPPDPSTSAAWIAYRYFRSTPIATPWIRTRAAS